MHRFFLNSKVEDPQNIVIKDKEIIKKITKVLRKNIGDTFLLFDNEANEYVVEVKEVNPKQIVCEFLNKNFVDRELDINIHLYQSILKKDKLEWVLQKATELGVKNITPVISENSIVREITANKLSRYKKIIDEATIQCGGKVSPVLNPIINFEQAVVGLNLADLNIIAYEQEKESKLTEILNNNQNINIFIGPEGGYSQEEIDLALRHSILPFSLGKRILRAETAAIVACSVIINY